MGVRGLMSELAEKLIAENLKTKNPILDLGYCGLDGTEDDLYKLLQDAKHLDTLIFSNEWWEEGLEDTVKSQNYKKSALQNTLKQVPDFLPKNLQKLFFAGQEWTDFDFEEEELVRIDTLEKLKNLTVLDLRQHQLREATILKRLPKLQKLNLSDNRIKDYHFLKDLKLLEHLNLHNHYLSDISFLEGLFQLKSLDLGNHYNSRGGEGTILNLEVLKIGKNLKKLTLTACGIKDTEVLSNLQQLEYLDLSRNEIEYCTFLPSLKKLKKLHLFSNALKEFILDAADSSLEYIGLDDNLDMEKISIYNLKNLVELSVDDQETEVEYIHYPRLISLKNLPKIQKLGFENLENINRLELENLERLEHFNMDFIENIQLDKLPNLKKIKFTTIESENHLNFLRNTNNIEELNIKSYDEIAFALGENLPKLKELNLDFSEIEQVSIENLPRLEKLSITAREITNLTLQNLPKLKSLSLHANQISKFDLSTIIHIKELEIGKLSSYGRSDETQWATTIDSKQFKNLEVLKLEEYKENLSFIQEFQNLKYLSLKECEIEDISFVEHLTNLQHLDLAFNEIEDISPLVNLQELTFLDLDSNKVKDLNPLTNLTNLKFLNLRNALFPELENRQAHIEILKPLIKLETLNLARAYGITNVSFMREFKELKTLDLSWNSIQNLDSFRGLENLEELKIEKNPLQNISYLKSLKALKSLSNIDNDMLVFPPIGYAFLKYEGGKLSDYTHLPELPQVEKVWQLLKTKDEKNQKLAVELAKGRGWTEEEIEMYQNLL